MATRKNSVAFNGAFVGYSTGDKVSMHVKGGCGYDAPVEGEIIGGSGESPLIKMTDGNLFDIRPGVDNISDLRKL